MSDNQIDQVEEIIEDIEAVEEAAEQKLPEDEKKSVDSVEKASDVTKKAPKRRGDKEAKDEPAQQGNVKMKEEFEEDLDALVASEATLSEGFRIKAAVIFEAALNAKVAESVERLEEQYEERLAEETETIKSDLVEKVDAYLGYVVEKFMSDNELAINNGLRTEIAEGFMSQLKDLFVENYIEVPESKVDLVDTLAENVEELEDKLNASIEDNVKLVSEVKQLQREAVIAEASAGLTVAQAEKLNALSENVSFDDKESFEAKVATIKESYFTAAPVVAAEEEVLDEGEEEIISESPVMNAYINALKIK